MKRLLFKFSSGVFLMCLFIAALTPISTSHAGWVPDEEPMSGASVTKESGLKGTFLANSSGEAQFPMAAGGYVIYPGTAWSLQFYLPKDSCFCGYRFTGETHRLTCVNKHGETCIP